MSLSPVIDQRKIAELFSDFDPSPEPFIENKIEKWLTTAEAADYLRVSPKTLLNLLSYGKIPYYKFGRRNRYLESELRKVLLAHPGGVNYGI
jgi:excisionase family DNA binding protein